MGSQGGQDVDGSDVLGSVATEMRERVGEATSWPQRFAVVDDVLAARAAAAGEDRRHAVHPMVEGAWRLLLRSGGTVRVTRFDRARRRLQRATMSGRPVSLADLAAESGCYDQAHLTRDFRQLAGCPPAAWVAQEFRNVQSTRGTRSEDWVT